MITENCPACGSNINVSDQPPFALTTCPACQAEVRVRTHFHHFEILREIGIGGMSRVFEANDLALQRRVALKILNPSCSREPHLIEQFEREARLTASFSHPHIVKVFSVGYDQGYRYITMELVPGGSLDDRILMESALPEEQVIRIAQGICEGLKVAHSVGLIHRDIKPGNILFAADGTCKLVDFGLALIQGRERDASGEIWATPYYVPPEKLDGQPDTHRGDMYSLGATLFHALAGRPPFVKDTDSIEELKAVKRFAVHLKPVAPHVSDECCQVIDRLLSRKPEHRYPRYEDIISHLDLAKKRLFQEREKKVNAASSRSLIHKPWFWAASAALLAIIVWWAAQLQPPKKIEKLGFGEAKPVAAESSTTRFMKARDHLARMALSEAHTAFVRLSTDRSSEPPLIGWSRYGEGIVALMQGQKENARLAFGAMVVDSEPLEKRGDIKTADFFRRGAVVLSAEEVETAALERNYILNGPLKPAGQLALGLRAWLDEKYDESESLLREFSRQSFPESIQWMQELIPIVRGRLHDLSLRAKVPLPTAELSLDVSRQRLREAEALVTQFQVDRGPKQKAIEAIAEWRTIVDQKESQAAVDRGLKLAERTAQEHQGISEAVAAAMRLRRGYRFQEGLDGIKAVEAQSPFSRQRRDDWAYLWEKSERFMALLTEDLNARSYTGDFQRLNAEPLTGVLVEATRQHWIVRSADTVTTIELAQIPPAFLIRVGETLLASTADSDDYYQRREAIVAFAQVCGLQEYARGASLALSRELRPFRDRWARVAQLQ